MKYLLAVIVLVLSSSCTAPTISLEAIQDHPRQQIRVNNDNPAIKAIQYINFSERTHRQELKDFIGVDPRRTEWCAAFVNAVLEESNIKSNNDHPYPLTARAFLDWGQEVSKKDIKAGDVVIFPRGNQGWQGHVGFYIRSVNINGVEYYYILGGNQNNKVSIEMYRANRALGIRRHEKLI